MKGNRIVMREEKQKTEEGIRAGNEERFEALDLVCFSHLRWNFVFQRPHHLLRRGARTQRVFYIEEPRIEAQPSQLVIARDPTGVWTVTPFLSKSLNREEARAEHIRLVNQLFDEHEICRYACWYYTPMAIAYSRQLDPVVVIYDCMDELSSFNGASPKMPEYEAELIKRADIVFTGGQSLYEAKRTQHPNVYPFPSSIEFEHFAQARLLSRDPANQATIPHPRLGFFGVIDERIDLDLIAGIADKRQDWQLVMIGPVAKVEPTLLPQRANIHYLGRKPYEDLPAYLAGWDVAILPFAQNRSTRFISPTKTPEYLAGGKPVVSSPILDVIRPYGKAGLVSIADGVDEFVRAVDQTLSLKRDQEKWLRQVDAFLSKTSWDQTWEQMKAHIEEALGNQSKNQPFNPGNGHLPVVNKPNIRSSRKSKIDQHAGRTQHRRTFDYLIVGAGFSGSVLAERLARGSGKKVLVIDRRPHFGGNAYDHYNEAGILVHKYGPHIFHTNSREVFSYLSRFTKWRPYEHRVLASVDGQLVPIPINLDTVNRLYGTNLSSFDLEKFFETIAEPVKEIQTSEDVVVSKVGRQLYEKFFRNYTRKQWDLDPSELDASVTARVPVRLNRDDRYFTDTYQAMPLYGYTQMFGNMLDHPNIHILLNTDFSDIVNFVSFRHMIFTGPIDEYFNYCYGKLPYRSLQFKFETLNEAFHQPVAVINYPNEHPYTRSTEFKHLTGQEHPKTTLVYEYPCAEGDPYYPIPRSENAALYKQYKKLGDSAEGVHFAGRLGTYRYYNMDQVTAQALTLYAKLSGKSKTESLLAHQDSRFAVELPCTLAINPEWP